MKNIADNFHNFTIQSPFEKWIFCELFEEKSIYIMLSKFVNFLKKKQYTLCEATYIQNTGI